VGRGYAAAEIDGGRVVARIRGKRIPAARERLQAEFPLAEPPRFETRPDWPKFLKWLERVPLLALRVEVEVTPQVGAVAAAE
jgi:hypothetical protein